MVRFGQYWHLVVKNIPHVSCEKHSFIPTFILCCRPVQNPFEGPLVNQQRGVTCLCVCSLKTGTWSNLPHFQSCRRGIPHLFYSSHKAQPGYSIKCTTSGWHASLALPPFRASFSRSSPGHFFWFRLMDTGLPAESALNLRFYSQVLSKNNVHFTLKYPDNLFKITCFISQCPTVYN